ncbi:uncharacterized protein At2g29880-like [Olea europaea var. sylvestris]|uniref:uncharacterized protein At2g29880-like n=1 Tax=Olea europaea var. sylvestris TaxID=158386 RepID=UPI000C1D19BA|nr:uncharacterized protein At2g29880-like [Olea europaea var. sylvestris]
MATMMVGDLQVRRRVVVSGSAVATVVAISDGCNAREDELLWCGDGMPVADSFLLPSHPEDKSYRTDTFPDDEDLRIAVGSGTAVGTHSIALGDDTDARTSYTEERRVRDSLIDDFMYDLDTEAFIVTDKQGFISSEVSPSIQKRSRTEFEAKSSSFEPKSTQSDIIDKLASTIGKITQAIESIDTREPNCWNIIKEIPNLDDDDRFKVLDLLNTKAKKSEFLSMMPE